MRWRVGRNPAAWSISLTSCQGQPVNAGWRTGPGAAPLSVFTLETSSFISTAAHRTRCLGTIFGEYKKDISQMQVFRN
jgi:hypothetical protein